MPTKTQPQIYTALMLIGVIVIAGLGFSVYSMWFAHRSFSDGNFEANSFAAWQVGSNFNQKLAIIQVVGTSSTSTTSTSSTISTQNPFDFTFAGNPLGLGIYQGASTQASITVVTTNGAPELVVFYYTYQTGSGLTGPSAEVGCTPNPQCTHTFTITASQTAPPGTYTVLVQVMQNNSPHVNHWASVTVTVNAAPAQTTSTSASTSASVTTTTVTITATTVTFSNAETGQVSLIQNVAHSGSHSLLLQAPATGIIGVQQKFTAVKTPVSVSVWFYNVAWPTACYHPYTQAALYDTAGHAIEFGFDAHGVAWVVSGNAAYGSSDMPGSVPRPQLNQWIQLTVDIYSDHLVFYINGVEVYDPVIAKNIYGYTFNNWQFADLTQIQLFNSCSAQTYVDDVVTQPITV